MAVEHIAGIYVMAPPEMTPARLASFHHFNQPLRTLMDRAVLPAASSIGSTIKLGLVKPDIIVSALGYLQWAALGADTTLSVGVADDAELGISAKDNILVNAAASASGGSAAITAAVAIGNRFKPLWELAGLTAAPTKQLTLLATLKGAASSAGGAVAWEIPFTTY